MFRARLSLFALESRENPSGPDLIDPIGPSVPPPPPSDPIPPTTPSIIDIGGAIGGGVVDAGSPPATPDDTNGIIKVSTDPYILP